ncbi:MAG: thioesterase family protein [Planctomycetota bacterium]
MQPFTKRYRYRFGDIDDAGIGYYPALMHYFHCGFEDWWSDGLGVPYPKVLHEEKFGLPAVNIQADFYQPIRYGDEPDFSLGVLRIGDTSVQFGMWLSIEGRGGPACRARITTVAVDMDKMAKRDLPDHWRTKFNEWLLDEAEFPDRS